LKQQIHPHLPLTEDQQDQLKDQRDRLVLLKLQLDMK